VRPVYVAGVGMTYFGKQPDRNLKSLTGEAVRAAVEDASADLRHVQAYYFANAVAGLITGQEMVRGQVTLRPLGVEETPVVNVENACASASTALHLGWLAVASGQYDAVVAVGAEKMTHPDKWRSFDAIGRALDVELAPPDEDGDHSPLMDSYAEAARAYMEESGATPHDFAAVAVKSQHNGALNPRAQYGGELTVDDVLAAREIAWPLTLYMCSPISDGAAAVLLSAEPPPAARRVVVAGSALRSGIASGRGWAKGAHLAAEAAYEAAGLGAEDVDVAELHDAAAPAELQLSEQVGLAPPGGGPALLREGASALGGRIPINTGGGLLARGHPIGATGLGQVFEVIQQLRGEAGPRQVEGADVALTQNGGGWLDGDNVAHAIHIFTR
jgi:acetyl-CoA acyltransferase